MFPAGFWTSKWHLDSLCWGSEVHVSRPKPTCQLPGAAKCTSGARRGLNAFYSTSGWLERRSTLWDIGHFSVIHRHSSEEGLVPRLVIHVPYPHFLSSLPLSNFLVSYHIQLFFHLPQTLLSIIKLSTENSRGKNNVFHCVDTLGGGRFKPRKSNTTSTIPY